MPNQHQIYANRAEEQNHNYWPQKVIDVCILDTNCTIDKIDSADYREYCEHPVVDLTLS